MQHAMAFSYTIGTAGATSSFTTSAVPATVTSVVTTAPFSTTSPTAFSRGAGQLWNILRRL